MSVPEEASRQPPAPPGQMWPSRPDAQDTFETARNHFDRFLVRRSRRRYRACHAPVFQRM